MKTAAAKGWRTARLGLLLAVALLGASCGNSKPSVESLKHGELEKLTILEKPPARAQGAFIDGAGKDLTLASFEGKVVVVNFWATWCAPCKVEMPTLAALSQAYRAKGVEVVAISLDKPDDNDLAKATLADLSKGALPFYQGKNYDLPFEVGVDFFPTTIVYDRKGAEVARLSGEADWNSAEARKLMDVALAR